MVNALVLASSAFSTTHKPMGGPSDGQGFTDRAPEWSLVRWACRVFRFMPVNGAAAGVWKMDVDVDGLGFQTERADAPLGGGFGRIPRRGATELADDTDTEALEGARSPDVHEEEDDDTEAADARLTVDGLRGRFVPTCNVTARGRSEGEGRDPGDGIPSE